MNRELLEKPFSPDQIKQREGLHGDVLDYIEGAGEGASSAPNGNKETAAASRGNGKGNGESQNGRLTAKQLSAIFALAKAKDWSNKDVRDFTHEMFGKMPDFLTKKEASAV